MQGGSRRSAMYGSLNWQHEDALDFLKIKNWHDFNVPGTDLSLADVKRNNFNYPAPLDMMNISLNYDDEFLKEIREGRMPDVFIENCKQAMVTGEPGFSFNFGDKQDETLRNACTEITSSTDSDVCNLGSINMGRIENISWHHLWSGTHLCSGL
jgi:ribonucleoside-diphosphate reductase alpha chain